MGEVSRSRLQALIADGHVGIGAETPRQPRHRVKAGEVVALAIPDAAAPDPAPENIPLVILHEDEALVVVDKPAGLVVHPGPGNWTGTLVNALLHHCAGSLSGIGGVKRPGIVHRLDKDTSGVMVVAKTDAAHRHLAAQFAAHGRDGRMERAYRALVWGAPSRPAGTVDAPLARSNSDRTKRMVAPVGRPDARDAVTRYQVEERFGGEPPVASLLRCVLETGRTHQIRVHLTHIGHPLIGDDVYGAGFRTKALTLESGVAALVSGFSRQALHAFRLGFEHPSTGAASLFESVLPPDMRALIDALRLLPSAPGQMNRP